MRAKELDFFNKLAQDRIKEKESIIKNNNMIIDYMQKNNIDNFAGDTISDLLKRNEVLQNYIDTAKK